MRAYFFFGDANHSPLAKLFKRGYQHVLAVIEVHNGIFLIDPVRGCVDMQYTNEHSLADIIARLQDGRTAVMIRYDRVLDRKRRIARGPIITCASYLAYTIGLPFRGVTPYQLFKTLKQQGAVAL